LAALDPLPAVVDAAGAGEDELPSLEVEEELSFDDDDDEPEVAVSDDEADLRLSVR
jgi:hypothetical protein